MVEEIEAKATERSKIKIVDWLVTYECMLSCNFCFVPASETQINPHDRETDRDFVIEQIKDSGVDGVNLTGGEPLIREDIGYIARELYHSGKRLILFTNTMLWESRIEDVQPYISIIRIPLGGSTTEIAQRLRTNPKQLEKAMGFLRYSSNSFEPSVYVGTVLTRTNIDDIINLGRIIEGFPHIKAWSIAQYCPRGKGLVNSHELSISDSEFEEATGKVNQEFPHLPITPVQSGKRDNAYVLILPDMQVVTPQGEAYKPIGHLKRDRLSDILMSSELDPTKYENRASCFMETTVK